MTVKLNPAQCHPVVSKAILMSVLLLLLSDINFECLVRIYNPILVSSMHCTPSNFRGSTRIASKIDTTLLQYVMVAKLGPNLKIIELKIILAKMQTYHIYSCIKYCYTL